MHSSVVIAEDDDLLREYFTDLLTDHGYDCRAFSRCSQALDYLLESEKRGSQPPDLIFSDINMPGLNGLGFLRATKEVGWKVPFVLVSGNYELPSAMEALRNGASDYLLKPATPDDILAVVDKHVVSRRLLPLSPGEYNLTRHPAGPQLLGLLNSLSARRIETLQHSRRVAAYSLLIGRACGETELDELELGALLHDIGKVGIPENVIRKPGPLGAEEWRVVRMHPRIGYEMLSPIEDMDGVADIILAHHESFNGTGYPSALAGDEIPLGARIFSVADSFDAMTSNRPYRGAMTPSEAREEINRQSGSQFDPLIVRRFLNLPDADVDRVLRQRDSLELT